MTKKVSLVLLLVGLMLVGIVGSASADVLTGKGKIVAHGRGFIYVQGTLKNFALSGKGTLIYSDRGRVDVPIINGEGTIETLPNGTIRITDFDGTFRLQDADQVTVNFVGHDIHMAAKGKGFMILRGSGHYRVAGQGGHWTTSDARIDFDG